MAELDQVPSLQTERHHAFGTAILVSGLTKSYRGSWRAPRRTVLRQFSLIVPEGQSLGIIGPNGAGKTTFLLLLLGLLRPDEGDVRIFAERPDRRRTRSLTGYLPEIFAPPGELTGYKYLLTLARLYGYDRASAKRRVAHLAQVWALEDNLDDRILGYSKGTIRRLGLARAFLNRPKLILLDEPTNSLDPPSVLRLREILRQASDEGATTMMVSHHLSEVGEICDRVIFLEGGSIRGDYDMANVDARRLFQLFDEQRQ